MSRFFVCCAVLLLSACASLQPPLANGRLSPVAGQGLAVIAFTAKSFNDDHADATLHISGAQGRHTLYTRLSTDFIRAAGDTPNAVGKLFVVPLAAGDYRLNRATGSWRRDSDMSLMNYEYVDVQLDQPFSVKAGEVVYLGQAHLLMNYRANVTFSDAHARDFYDLSARSGVTDFSNIVIKPLTAANQ